MNESKSRRSFLASSIGAATAFQIIKPELVRGQGKEKLKAGLIGCGGRGTQAMQNILTGCDNVEIVAMADVFEDRMEDSIRTTQGPEAGTLEPFQSGCRAPLRRLRRLQEAGRQRRRYRHAGGQPRLSPAAFRGCGGSEEAHLLREADGHGRHRRAPFHGRRQEIAGTQADGEIGRAAAFADLVSRQVQAR